MFSFVLNCYHHFDLYHDHQKYTRLSVCIDVEVCYFSFFFFFFFFFHSALFWIDNRSVYFFQDYASSC